MGTLYVDTGGNALNSGSSDNNAADLSGSNATVSGSVVTLDGSPDLSGLITSGANQSSINIAQATNSNQKIFWITAFDNSAKTVTVSVAPTGVTGSGWRIGGRHVLTNASIEGAVRAGDTVIFNNSPASSASAIWTFRNPGTTAGGFAKIMGKSGVRPVLTYTGTSVAITMPALCWVENLEIVQSGASGNAFTFTGGGSVLYNVKISDAGGDAINAGSQGFKIVGCEITGAGGTAIAMSTVISGCIVGNYIHDNGSGGITNGGSNVHVLIALNIFDSNGSAEHVYFSGTFANQVGGIWLIGNTFYGGNDDGFRVDDADAIGLCLNNIFLDNGNAAGEYNINWPSGDMKNTWLSIFNIFSIAGGRGGANLNNVTVGSTELTSDPALTNPAGGDFSLPSSSPAKAAGFPGVLLGANTGYMDIGPVQRQESGAGMLVHPGMGGGMRG